MATTYTLISSNVLSSSAASVTFSSIPSTYTDLVVRFSVRTDSTSGNQSQVWIKLNGLTTSIYSFTRLYATGTTTPSDRSAATAPDNISSAFADSANATANTFASNEIYIPSYTASQNKQISIISAQENNATQGYMSAVAELVQTTAAVSSLEIATGSNFVSGSSFYLYGIKNS